MDTSLLTQLGLNETQAKAYVTLIKAGSVTPPQLAALIGETRTNTYAVLDKLVELGLACKDDTAKKATYRPTNPTALEKLVTEQRQSALQREQLVRGAMPALLDYFYTYSEQPGVRYFQGHEGIMNMYRDQLRTNQPVTLVRTRADLNFFGGFDGISKIREKFNKSPISRHMLTPDAPEVRTDWLEHDTASGNTRTWYKDADYDAPVEWGVYGDKVAIISFGEEAMGMIIESPQIATAMRQILGLMDRGLKAAPDYETLPKRAAKDPKTLNF